MYYLNLLSNVHFISLDVLLYLIFSRRPKYELSFFFFSPVTFQPTRAVLNKAVDTADNEVLASMRILDRIDRDFYGVYENDHARQ